MAKINHNKLNNVIDLIIAQPSVGPMAYAQTYAHAIRKHRMTGVMLYEQIPYVLGNLGEWRGETARAVKTFFRDLEDSLSFRCSYCRRRKCIDNKARPLGMSYPPCCVDCKPDVERAALRRKVTL